MSMIDDDNDSGDNKQNASVKLYEYEWTHLYNIFNISELRDSAIKGELRASKFRSICWALLLELLPSDSSEWLTTITHFRHIYELIKLKHDNDPHKQDSGPDNPLSQDDNSTWKLYFEDRELKEIIKQDVFRTSPEIEYFRKNEVRTIMINILFCYSREHPDLSYKQGMHEILAPLLFVLHCDHQALLQVLEQSSSDVSDLIQQILNPKYLEADAYSLFNVIMDRMKAYYYVNDDKNEMAVSEKLKTVKITRSMPESIIVGKISKLRDTMLMKYDPELREHLLNLDISLTTFGVRWLRLMFGGEFSLMDLLVIWDTIFAKSPQDFALVNYIFVSMLILLRGQLLKSDNTNCLNLLMRYPHVDVMTVVEYALHIFDPKTYILPTAINFINHDKRNNLKTNILDAQPERPSTIVSNYSTRRLRNTSDDLLELCRVKMLEYHSILNPVVPNHNKEARQALSGMLELCGMLNSRPGIIEMGKDVVRSTSAIQTSLSPETPEGGPLLPPPASDITMKVFSKTESSINSQIQGAPTKNPLKQMKRFQQDNDNTTVGISTIKTCVKNFDNLNINKLAKDSVFNVNSTTTTNVIADVKDKPVVVADIKTKLMDEVRQNNIYTCNKSIAEFVKLSDLVNHHKNLKSSTSVSTNRQQPYGRLGNGAVMFVNKHHTPTAILPWANTLGNATKCINVAEQDKKTMTFVRSVAIAKNKNVVVIVKRFPKPTCTYPCLIGMALKNSATGALLENEICDFVYRHFPYFRSAQEDRWRKSIRESLVKNSFFQTRDEELNCSYNIKLRLLKDAVWHIDRQRVIEMDRKIRCWARSDIASVKKTMLYPKLLEKWVRGVPHIQVTAELITTSNDNNSDSLNTVRDENHSNTDVNDDNNGVLTIKEEPYDDEDDDNPFDNVTITSEDVTSMLMDLDSSKTISNGFERQPLFRPRYHTTTMSVLRRTSKKPERSPLKPFMTWAKIQRRKIMEEQPIVHIDEVSKRLGTMRNTLTAEEQQPFFRQAEHLKKLHSKEHPDYKYQPRKKIKLDEIHVLSTDI